MASDAFLVLTDEHGNVLPGETQDRYFGAQKFKAVEIASFSFGIHNTTTIRSGSSGAGSSRAQFTDLTISKVVDSVSVYLLNDAGSGTLLRQMDLYVRRAGGGQTSPYFLKYSFKPVYVTDIQWSYGGDANVAESVTFAYGALQISYTRTNADGTSGPVSSGAWDQITETNRF